MHSFRIRLFCVNKSVTAEEARGSAVSFTVCLKEQLHCGLCEELPKGTVETCSGARPQLPCSFRKKGSCSDNPGVFFHTCPGLWSCRDQTLLSLCPYFPHLTKGTFSAKHTPQPPGNKRKSSGRGENDTDKAQGGPDRHARVSKNEAHAQASPLPLLKSCQYDGVP